MDTREPAHTIDDIPNSVRYVKNGRGGRWWRVAREKGQIHAGWAEIPSHLLENPQDFSEIDKILIKYPYKTVSARRNILTQLRYLLSAPSQHTWITFEDGRLWWCTVEDGVVVNPETTHTENGHFWLTCKRPWSDCSLRGKRLARADLPGIADRVAGFRATVCRPREEAAILRLIRGEVNKLVEEARSARDAYQEAVSRMISDLKWQDFEQLIDLILTRTGWARISKLGGYEEGFDIEAENLAAGETAFVQVKSEAPQSILDDYVRLFTQRRNRYHRMIFADHNPKGRLTPPSGLPVQVWTTRHLAELVVRLGLGEWMEHKLG